MNSQIQIDKAFLFCELHQRAGAFFIPNPWDAGSACILAQLGFEALATSSAASAATLGRRDGRLMRDEALSHARTIAEATNLPVSADLENGFFDDPTEVAKTVRLAARAGLVGCSIEDAPSDRNSPVYEMNHAADRITAAAEAAQSLPFRFTLTGRCENFIRGNPDLDNAIQRLVAYEEAGADVLFAPGLPNLDAVRAVCSAVAKPVNFMVGIRDKSFTATELIQAGVKRISFASSLYRAAMTHLAAVAGEIHKSGTFNYLENTMTAAYLNGLFPS
jgi:2-methylisocitrate lyase-like PEP mutase family enzyme